ncbi:MAG TPA: TetR/AcrR family transcriptional regulator [Myxococcota bacterium]|nr:TetR/AcrR family transcriptional regulator [Myxococcota bacterium]
MAIRAARGGIDGRTLRAERSREAIVAAIVALVGEGTPVPTAQQVADRAGVGIRTVFRHFSDMESLFAEVSERVRAEMQPLLRGRPPEGAPDTRLSELARRRARLFERILPYRRSTQIQRSRSPFLESQLRADHRELRAELRRWLPEIGDADRLEALDAALSPELWMRLRVEQRLGVRRAEAVYGEIARAVAGDLPG